MILSDWVRSASKLRNWIINCIFRVLHRMQLVNMSQCINYITLDRYLSNDSFGTKHSFFLSHSEQVSRLFINRSKLFQDNVQKWIISFLHTFSPHITWLLCCLVFFLYGLFWNQKMYSKIFTSLFPDIPLMYTLSTILVYFPFLLLCRIKCKNKKDYARMYYSHESIDS